MKKFESIEYLKDGNLRQVQSYKILKSINIFNILKEFNPILVGTIPIGIDIEKSDLDIVCQINLENKENFKDIIVKYFSQLKKFKITDKFLSDGIILINFFTEPTFAKLLNLNGNPYEELLNLEFLTDKEIIDKLRELGYEKRE